VQILGSGYFRRRLPWLCVTSRNPNGRYPSKISADDNNYYKMSCRVYSRSAAAMWRARIGCHGVGQELTQPAFPTLAALADRISTVLHACRKIALLRSSNTDLTRDINSLLKVLRNYGSAWIVCGHPSIFLRPTFLSTPHTR
jgi:hypothetical protein